MAILDVHHRTTYRYDRSVGFGPHRWMFRPRDSQEQRLISSERRISPEPSSVIWQHDVFGNQIAVVQFDSDAQELTFESEISVEHSPELGLTYTPEDDARIWPFEYPASESIDLAPYQHVHYPDQSVAQWVRSIAPSYGARTAEVLTRVNSAISETVAYTRRSNPGTQRPSVTLSDRRGTCRDFALLMMEAARMLGFAARFVSGYLYAPSRDSAEARGGGASHAWVQIFLPGSGWVEFDPTNGIVGSRDLIRVGVARDPSQAMPLRGSFIGPRGSYLGMDVDVSVRRQQVAAPSRPARAIVG